MKTTRSIAFLTAILLIASLAACVRPIPGTSKDAAKTESPAGPQSGATDVLEQIYLFATQTAMATQGITSNVPSALETMTTVEAPAIPVESEVPPMQAATPEPAQLIVAPSATPGLPKSYTLATGEFPYCIARRFDVDPGALLRANNLTSYSVYFSGMVLTIPQNTRGFPGSRALRPHPATYTVRSGDTLNIIACAFGDVDPNMIAFVNNLEPNARLTPGEVLQIP